MTPNFNLDCTQLRRMGNAYLAAAEIIERGAGITATTTTTTSEAPKRVISEATRKKMRAAALKRKKNKIAQVQSIQKAA